MSPVFLQVRPSRWLLGMLFWLHLLALTAVLLVLPWPWLLPAGVVLTCSFCYQWWHQAGQAPDRIRALRLHSEGFGELQLTAGTVAVRLRPLGFAAGGLQVLHFEALAETRRRYCLLLLPDSLPRDQHAALRRCLYSYSALD